jgi:hypothetical protein
MNVAPGPVKIDMLVMQSVGEPYDICCSEVLPGDGTRLKETNEDDPKGGIEW